MKLLCLTLLLAFCGAVCTANANSYLEMITTAPTDSDAIVAEAIFTNQNNEEPAPQPLWYDTRITTHAPVVFSDYPKYIAWKQAQERENTLQFDSHEFIQNMIYNVEGGLAIWGIYEIYKYH